MDDVAKLKLPIGIADFAQIRTGSYYYVDKTQFIEDYCTHYYHAGMITRPAYFGKSLCITMLKQFLEVGTDKSLFDGLYISRQKEFCDKFMGKFRVISISFKDVCAKTYKTALRQLNAAMTKEVQRHHFSFENDHLSGAHDEQVYHELLAEEKEEATLLHALADMIRLLRTYYDEPLVLLIDDWDTPLFAALQYGYYDEMAYTIRCIVEFAVDGCSGIEFSLLTSSMHIPIGGGYFDPYNYGYRSIFDGCYEKMAGFTESETKAILNYYDINDGLEELKQYCGEYRVGKELLFNPELVFEYVGEKLHDSSATIATIQRKKTDERERAIIEMIMRKYADVAGRTGQYNMDCCIKGKPLQGEVTPHVKYNGNISFFPNSAIWSIFLLRGYMISDCYAERKNCWFSVANEKYRKLLIECMRFFQ